VTLHPNCLAVPARPLVLWWALGTKQRRRIRPSRKAYRKTSLLKLRRAVAFGRSRHGASVCSRPARLPSTAPLQKRAVSSQSEASCLEVVRYSLDATEQIRASPSRTLYWLDRRPTQSVESSVIHGDHELHAAFPFSLLPCQVHNRLPPSGFRHPQCVGPFRCSRGPLNSFKPRRFLEMLIPSSSSASPPGH
jgi:hypothetical protein